MRKQTPERKSSRRRSIKQTNDISVSNPIILSDETAELQRSKAKQWAEANLNASTNKTVEKEKRTRTPSKISKTNDTNSNIDNDIKITRSSRRLSIKQTISKEDIIDTLVVDNAVSDAPFSISSSETIQSNEIQSNATGSTIVENVSKEPETKLLNISNQALTKKHSRGLTPDEAMNLVGLIVFLLIIFYISTFNPQLAIVLLIIAIVTSIIRRNASDKPFFEPPKSNLQPPPSRAY